MMWGLRMDDIKILLVWGFRVMEDFSVGMGWVWRMKSNSHGSPHSAHIYCCDQFKVNKYTGGGYQGLGA